MKLWLVTGKIPPQYCGVGDFTARLAEAFSRRGHDVEILTSSPPPYEVGSTRVWSGISGWDRRGFSAILERATRLKPDRIYFQWAPYLYHRRGWNFWAAWAAWNARAAGLRWETLVHEPFVDWSWSRNAILGLGQRLALGSLISASYRSYATIQPWVDLLSRDIPGAYGKVRWAPVGSTIRPTGIRQPHIGRARMGIFSPLGSGKEPLFVEKIWHRLQSLPMEMVVIGLDRAQWPGAYRDDPRWRFTGKLSESEVSAEMASLDFLLSPFVDGISARRTSALAALAHGVPLLTNGGRLTDSVFYLPESFPLIPKDAGSFEVAVRSLLANSTSREDWIARGLHLYQRYFSWDVLVDRLLDSAELAEFSKVASGGF